MQVLRFFSLKTLAMSLLILIILGAIPESLFSQSTSSSSTPSSTNAPVKSIPPKTTPSRPAPSRPPPSRSAAKTSAKKNADMEGIPDVGALKRPSLITQAVLLSLLSLMPFIIMILTSFLKIVVVLSLLRSALGVQQAPPNQVINGVAFLLSLFIMFPTGIKMYQATEEAMAKQSVPESFLSPDSSSYVIEVAAAAAEPLRQFLERNSSGRHQALFYRLAYRGIPEEFRDKLKPNGFIVLVPSYITGQLKAAFEIGVLIYIPFFVIDLVTSNILLAMGMMMLSPVTISMPLKLFLLVMLDGWTILIEGLVKTFQ